MKQEYFELGQIVNHFGIKGMIKVNPFTADITKFDRLDFVLIEKDNKYQKAEIEEVKYSKNQVLLKLKGINSIEEAEQYRGCYLKLARKDMEELPENTYYIADLIGLSVYTDEKILLGKVHDIYNLGANDIYVIKTDQGKQILLPAIKEVIKQIDMEQEKITVHLIKGLVDDEK